MADDHARLRGASAAKRKLKAVADRLARITDAAVSDFADDVKLHMKGVVPVDTGELKESIDVQKTGKGYSIGPRGVDYAGFVENGTSRSPAQPYVAPTIQWAKANGPKRIARRIKGEISE